MFISKDKFVNFLVVARRESHLAGYREGVRDGSKNVLSSMYGRYVDGEWFAMTSDETLEVSYCVMGKCAEVDDEWFVLSSDESLEVASSILVDKARYRVCDTCVYKIVVF